MLPPLAGVAKLAVRASLGHWWDIDPLARGVPCGFDSRRPHHDYAST